MANIKNNQTAPKLLQRLFMYDPEQDGGPEEKKNVRAFCDWLPNQINPATGKNFDEISDNSMYRYVRGEAVPSWDILLAVTLYFQDAQLYSTFNMAPSLTAKEKFQAKLHEAEEEAKKAAEKVKMLKSVLKKSNK